MVTDEERDYMYRVFAKDARARINLGIRRRLAPLLSNDRKKIELLNILLFSLPGTPVIYYGDEIGMGDNYYLGDRNGVRTPMQWSFDKNAGFSDSNPQRLYLPVIIDPEYHYETLNVENQERNPASLLWWMKRIIGIRKSFKTFGRGTLEFLYPSNPSILAFIRKYDDRDILVTVNLSRFSQAAEIDLSEYSGYIPEEIFSSNEFPRIRKSPYLLTFGGYDYYWFVLKNEQMEYSLSNEEGLPSIVSESSWKSFPDQHVKRQLERKVLPRYLVHARWFGEKAMDIQKVTISESIPVSIDAYYAHILLLDVVFKQGPSTRYVLPLSFAAGSKSDEVQDAFTAGVVCNLRIGDQAGTLYDAVYDEKFGILLLQMIAGRKRTKGGSSELAIGRSRKFSSMLDQRGLDLPAHVTKAEQSNSSILYGNVFFLKMYRKLEEGENSEIEILSFLTDRAGYQHIPKYGGDIEIVTANGSTALAILQGFVPNQGDAWTYALNTVNSYFDIVLTEKPDLKKLSSFLQQPLIGTGPDTVPELMHDLLGSFFIEMIELLGKRTAELHLALSSSEDDPAFRPENFSLLYQRSLYQSMRGQTRRAMQLLSSRIGELPETVRESSERIMTLESDILTRQHRIVQRKIGARKIRSHGDFHLGQALFTGKDFVIIDFEGEPARAMSERRLKRCPLRDVAGMIRSFHYAVHTSLNFYASSRPGDITALEPWAEPWFHAVSGLFLHSYLEMMKGSDVLPEKREDIETLLDAYMLEKAVYELMYELNNRPGWVGIPIQGIEQILGGK